MTACATLYTDPLGGPTMRCGRSLGHAGPHDPMAMPRAVLYLVPPAEPFAWQLTPAEADMVDRALATLYRELWHERRGQSADVQRKRDAVGRLRVALASARATVSP